MRENDIRSELLDTSQSILPDRGVPHTCVTKSFEGRSVEGFHVNSHLFSISVVSGNYSVSSMRCGQPADEWYVFENHAEWRMCLFLVPRLTAVERPSSLVQTALFRAFALFAHKSCAVLPSVVSSFSLCVVTSLCDAHDDSSSMAQENYCCTVITIHVFTHGSGAVAVIRFARPCTAEGLLVIWWYCG